MEKLTISSGNLKGKKIQGVDDKRTRYTPSKVKNSLFSIICSNIEIEGADFLELCAASGQIGIEAISRGAGTCTFVDISPLSIKTLKNNVNALEISNQIKIIKQDMIRFLRKTDKRFDIVFIDTPFIESLYKKMVSALLCKNDIIHQNGLLIVETQKRFESVESKMYDLIKSHEYGTIRIDMYKHKEQFKEEEKH